MRPDSLEDRMETEIEAPVDILGQKPVLGVCVHVSVADIDVHQRFQRSMHHHGRTFLILTNVADQDLADANPIYLALNRYVLQNCPKDYLAYQQRKRQNNPFKKNPLIVKTEVPLLSGNSTPETAESYRSQAQKLIAVSNYQAAIVAYDRAIALDPSTASDYFYRSWSLYQVKKLELALTDLDRAIQLNPDNADYYLGRGLIIATMGDRKTALANYSRAIELNPKLAQAYHQRSSLRRELGDIEGANLDRAMAVKLGIK